VCWGIDAGAGTPWKASVWERKHGRFLKKFRAGQVRTEKKRWDERYSDAGLRTVRSLIGTD